MLRKTALFQEHQRLGGRLIDFGGWELPVQYAGVMAEHLTCRSAAGLFDVSHMGEVHVEGPDAEAYLNYLVTNQVTQIAVGQAQYTVMCTETGGIVDDLIIYKRASDRFLLVVNASNTEKDYQWMRDVLARNSQRFGKVQLSNESSQYTQIAIQGPKAALILQTVTQTDLSSIKTYWFAEGKVLGSIPAVIARTGYTGEDGFEVYIPWDKGPELWRALLEAGAPHGLKPCGLGARDTLRLEMKYPLYGNELSNETLPLETGLGWVTKLDKGDFVGREAILAAKSRGLKRQLVGIQLSERGIPRHGYGVYDASGSEQIGMLTSGTQSPSLKLAIGIASLDLAHSRVGTSVRVDIRGQKVAAQVVSTPFYKRPY